MLGRKMKQGRKMGITERELQCQMVRKDVTKETCRRRACLMKTLPTFDTSLLAALGPWLYNFQVG